MFNSAILEVAIGVVFIYALFSTICTALREGIEAWLKTRAAYLEYGIREMLHDKKGDRLAKDFFEHPMIFSLYSGQYQAGADEKLGLFTRGHDMPSYIPSRNFSTALLDLVARGPVGQTAGGAQAGHSISLESLRENARLLGNAPVARAVLNAIDMAEGNLAKAQANLEAWYDSAMDRVSGWYKRNTQKMVFGMSLILAILFNVDTIGIANSLYQNTSAREVVAGLAQSGSPAPGETRISDIQQRLEAMPIPIGWTDEVSNVLLGRAKPPAWWWWLEKFVAPIPGWLLTALAATLGAPFWFDVLNRVMVVRSTVKPHQKSPEEASEDRQRPADRRDPGNARIGQQTRASDGDDAANDDTALDGCGAAPSLATPDDALPAAEGGVLR